MSKRRIFIIILALITLAIVFGAVSKRSAYRAASTILDFKISRNNSIDTFSEEWLWNGDGYIFIVITVSPDQFNNIKANCIIKNYKKLPLKNRDKLVELDETIYKYISQNDSNGYYKLEFNPNDFRSYSLIIFNQSLSKIIISGEEY